MQQIKIESAHRLEIVDALRGLALMGIILLHNIEKFDFYYFPPDLPLWIQMTDKGIWETLFFLFGGKAYAIFALLFGFSFFIQLNNQEKKGNDFRLRFLWRLFLLLLFGIVNSIFYLGDILALYAVLGISLLLVSKWSDKTVLITAIVLLLQPLQWGKFFYALSHVNYTPENYSTYLYTLVEVFQKSTSFFELATGNLWTGRMAAVSWSWENGRFFQATALFMFGMLLGRRGTFQLSETNLAFWKKTGWIAFIFFVPLFCLKTFLSKLVYDHVLLSILDPIISSWSNFAFMLVLVSSFIWLYQNVSFYSILSKLAPFGRMSLTNYVTQSIIGSFLYYGYGLGLYRYCGPTYSLLIGILIFVLQVNFSRWWLTKHTQGPLERLWHKATWSW